MSWIQRKFSVGDKFAALTTGWTAAIMAVAILAVVQHFNAQDETRSKRAAQVAAASIGTAVQGVFETAFNNVGETRDDLIALRQAGVADPVVYDTLLQRMIQSAPEQFGAWLVWDRDDAPLDPVAARAATGRMSVYWHQNGMAMLRDVVPADIVASRLFKVPYAEGKPYLLEPHAIDAANGDPTLVTSFAIPIQRDGRTVGALAVDIKLEAIADALGAIELPGGAAVTVVSDGGIVAMSTDKDMTGRPLARASGDWPGLFEAAKRDGDGSRLDPALAGSARTLTSWNAIRFAGVKNPWVLLMRIPQRSLIETTSNDRVYLALVAAAALFAILLVVSQAMRRLVGAPLASLSAIITGLGAGLFDYTVPCRHRSDEIGEIARAVERLQDSRLEIARLQEAHGEAEYQRLVDRRSELDGISDKFSGSIEGLVASLERVASTMGTRSQHVSSHAEAQVERLGSVAAASTAARDSMGSVAAATAALLATIDSIGERTRDSRSAAEKAEAHVVSTAAAMAELSQAIDNIDGVARLIGEVAAQINLIALNATIEAARAGESGRGFAVVANEIKVLAKRTATATGEIASYIAIVQEASNLADGKVVGMRGALAEMRNVSAEIAQALDIQLGATSEIGGLMEAALAGGESASRHVAGLERSAGEVHDAAQVMNAESGSLGAQIVDLRSEVEDFLRFLRSA